MNQHVPTPDAVAAVCITDQLHARSVPAPDYLREKIAIQDLAEQMVEHPAEVLPRLVKLGMDICGAESAGVSVLESESGRFRWLGLSGILSRFENATTPRDHSPCGVCLDQMQPILMEHPERVYDWIRDPGIIVPEVLLVPLQVKGGPPLGTLWVVAKEIGHFNGGHARVMQELAAFAGMALRIIQDEERLKAALHQQEMLTQEMSHRVKNLFALFDGMMRMSARTAATPQAMTQAMSGRLQALARAHDLVRRAPGSDGGEGADLEALAEVILRPHNGKHQLAGPNVPLGRQTATDLALMLHELATNASKYGSLGHDGAVSIVWTLEDDELRITWEESGGPKISAPPTTAGFGTRLTRATLGGRLGGTIANAWDEDGLRVAMTIPAGNLAR